MTTPASIQIVGSLPGPWEDDIARFQAALAGHTWGGDALRRLVVVADSLPATLQTWMLKERYEQWQASYTGRINVTGAIHFEARDGLSTAVVLPLPALEQFMTFAGHEMVEAALSERAVRDSYQFRDGTTSGMAHVWWTEYVAERVRTEIAQSLGWPVADIEQQQVSMDFRSFLDEIPALLRWAVTYDAVPPRLYQLLFELARIYCMTLGRAHGGNQPEQHEVAVARGTPLAQETKALWSALDTAMPAVYSEHCRTATADVDEVVSETCGAVYHAVLADFWNPRYDRELRR